MHNRSQHFNHFLKFAPVDWGIGVLANHWRQICFLGLPVLIAELLVGYVLYSMPMTPKVLFVASIALGGVHAWFLGAVFAYFINLMRHEYWSYFQIAKHSLVFLPKVFLSYSLFSLLINLGIRFPPALIMLFFFMWAPVFCAAESLAIGNLQKLSFFGKEDEEEEYDACSDDKELCKESKEKKSFQNVSVLDLGVGRSMQLVGKNLIPSFQVFVLFWAAFVVPLALVYLSLKEPSDLWGQFFQVSLSATATILVSGLLVGAFLSLLTESSFAELGLLPEDFHFELLNGRHPWALGNAKPGLFFFIAFLSIVSSLYYAYMSNKLEPVPLSVVYEVETLDREDDNIVIRVKIQDEERQFRWFDIEQFRVVYDSKRIPGASSYSISEKPRIVNLVKPKVERSLIYSMEGELLAPPFFKPHYGDILVVLRLPIPSSVPKNSQVFLYYGHESSKKHGIEEPLFRGELPVNEIR